MNISLRMQAIQKYLLSKKQEDPTEDNLSSRNPQFRTIDSTKYTPVLTSKSTERNSKVKSRDIKSRDISSRVTRDVSPISHTSAAKLSSTSSSQIFKKLNRRAPLGNSNSVEIIKPAAKLVEKAAKIKTPQKNLTRSPKKVPKASVTEISMTRESSRTREIKPKSKPKPKTEIEKVWRKALNTSNGIEAYAGSFRSYNVYIGKGNNSLLVKSLFLRRPWWKIVENKEAANFVWSQWKDKGVVEELKCCSSRPVIKDEQPVHVTQALSKLQNGRYTCSVDLDSGGIGLIQRSKSYIQFISEKIHSDKQRLHNRFEFNQCLTNKRGLYTTMRNYYTATNQYIFDKLPITFTVENQEDEEYQRFLALYNRLEAEKKESRSQNLWILKPGEFTNRGNGITVCQTLEEINAIIKPAAEKSYIVQKYIENPLLINKRKFDIRCYAMITGINGIIQGYFYLDGYLRTTSKEFSMEEISNPFIHLTNDAIQKHSTEYGKYENGNKLSYREFQKYLDQHFPDKKNNFFNGILPQIREIIKDTMKASFMKIDKNRRLHCMEVLGYDFMIDQNFKPWLIEINTNPCLETSSPHLRNIIPAMLDNAFKIVLDSLFPPPVGHKSEFNGSNRFELVFHEEVDGKELIQMLGENVKFLEE